MTHEQKQELDALNEALKYSIFVQTGCMPIMDAAQSYRDHYEEIQALKSGEWVLVPIEPTNQMLEDVGTMEGYDGANCSADNDHIEWYKAMIAARPKLGENNDK